MIIWSPHPYLPFLCSTDGEVRPLIEKWRNGRRPHRIINTHGYPAFGASLVHRLVLETFVGLSGGLQGQHKNDVKTDNRLSNLKWGTHQQNMDDAERNGTWARFRGEGSPRAKLTQKQVNEIRALYGKRRGRFKSEGLSVRQIAAMYGVGHVAIVRIGNGHRWVKGSARFNRKTLPKVPGNRAIQQPMVD